MVSPLVARLDAFLQSRENAAGVTPDDRGSMYPSEEIRLSIVPQLTGYIDLYRRAPSPRYLDDIVARADYLVANWSQAESGGPFDGMLAYALLAATEVTGAQIYADRAADSIALCLDPATDVRLNGGLMCAMGLAKHHELSGSTASLAKARSIVDGVVSYQHADGCFPHWCPGTKDIHYSAWMAMELLLIDRSIDHAPIQTILSTLVPFLDGRITATGESDYDDGGQIYWSYGSGCASDYDTRGWVNELGYLLYALDDPAHAVTRDRVLGFIEPMLGTDDGLPDKWGYPVSPSDPAYPFAIGDPSVIRTSLVFWAAAAAE
jgi:hypothetical protein